MADSDSSLGWDDLSDAPPAPMPTDSGTPAPADPPDPQVSAMLAQANSRIAKGEPEADVESWINSQLQKSGKKPQKVDESSSSDWDSLSATPPAPKAAPSALDTDQAAAQAGYNPAPNYTPTALSPVSRDAPPDNGDVPAAVPALTQAARAADALAAGPVDNRREVGFAEAAPRYLSANLTAGLGLVKGAAATIGYPITAADAALSGQPVPSLTDVVSSAEAPQQAERAADELNPKTEKPTLGGQIGMGAGGAAGDLLQMAATGPGKAAATGANLAEQLATKLFQTARVSSLPAARSAQDAAQSVIDDGGTPEDASKAALSAYDQTIAGNLLPVSAAGKIPTRAATGAAIGAGQAALNGGDAQSIASGAVVGAGMGVGGGHESAEPVSKAESARQRVEDLSNQVIKDNHADQAPQDQRIVSGAGVDAASSGDVSDAASQPEPAAKTAAKEVPVNDKDTGSSTPDSARPAFTPEERQQQSARSLADSVPDLSDEQKQAIVDNYPAVVKDRVTDFHRSEELNPTIEAARASGEPAAYAEVDLRNLGGLNKASGSNSAADAHFKAMADIIHDEAKQSGADVVPIRKGGDEMGVVFKGIDGQAAHDVMQRAQARIADYAQENNLHDIANPKGGDVGTGIHFGVSDIHPGESTSVTIRRADSLVEARKVGAPYEHPGSSETVRNPAEPAEGSTARSVETEVGGDRGAGSARTNQAPEPVYDRSQRQTAEVIQSPEAARKTATSAFGDIGKAKLERSGVKYISRAEIDKHTPELSPAQRDGVKGFSRDGKAYVVYDNVSHDELPNTIVHEVWHTNADRVLPPDKQTQLAQAIRQRAKSSPEVKAALDRIPKDTPKANLDKEVIAQTLGDLHNQPVSKKVLDTIKLGLNRLGVPLGWLNAHDAAIREIGIQNLRHFAESPHSFQTEGGERHTSETYKPRVRVPVEDVPVNRIDDTKSEEPHRVTSIKNAQVNKEREARGDEILHSVKGATNKEAMDEAGSRLEKDPDLGRRLTAELLKTPRPLNKTEVAVMLHDRVRIHNDLQDAYDAAEKNPDDAGNIARIKDLEVQRDANDRADRLAGTENSLGLSARRMMADEDYSLVNMVKQLQVASGKKELAPAVMKHVREIDRQMRAMRAPKRSDNSPRAIKDEFESLKNELAAIAKKPSSKPEGVLYSRDTDDQTKSFAFKKWFRGSKVVGDDGKPLVVYHGTARDISEFNAGNMRGEKRTNGNATGEWGTYFSPSPKEASIYAETSGHDKPQTVYPVHLSIQNPYVMGRAEWGRESQRANKDRSVASERRQHLEADGHDGIVIRDRGFNDEWVAFHPEQIKSAIGNRGTFDPKNPNILYARAEPHIADVIRRMAANRQAAGIPEETALREIHESVSPHADVSIKDIRDAINEPKSARRQANVEKRVGELGRKIAQKDFTKPQRYKPVYDESTLEAEGKMNALQRRFDNLKRMEEQKNQSRAMKVGATIHNVHLASILASLKVYPKLAGAVAARYISHGLEQATGALVQHFPGISHVAKMAESQRVSWGGEGQYIRGIGKSFKNAKDQLLRGYSDLDAKYGGKDTITDEYTDYAGSLFGGVGDAIAEGRKLDALRGLTSGVARFEGRTHGMIKEFASTPKFYESYFNIAKKLESSLRYQGMKEPEIQEFMSRRSTDMQIGTKAYLNALEDKLQGKNALADGVNRMLVSWDNSDNAGLQALSLAFQTIFPIRKIPMNIAKEVSSLAFGGVKAIAAARKELTPERADYIMKNIKKQGAGAALFSLAYLMGPTVFGGVPQSGDSKKHLPVKPGEANIGGVEISDAAFHSALGQLLQLGAGYRRAYESYYGHSHEAITAGLEAFGDQFSSQMVRQIPYLDQPRRWMQTAEYAQRDGRTALGEIAGNQLRSMAVPGFVQQIARDTDKYKGFRKPKNIIDDVKLGIPGYREEVSK